MSEPGQQSGAAASTATLHGAFRDPEHLRRLGDGIVEHVHEHQRHLLVMGQLPQGRHDLEGDVAFCRRVIAKLARCRRVQQALVAGADFWPGAAPPDLVKTGIHDDPVQPGCHGRLAAEAIRSPERGDHRVLQGVGGVLRVGQRSDRDGPEPVPVPQEQRSERVGIACDVPAEQFSIGDVRAGLSIRPRRPGISRGAGSGRVR
jgi:hypothetical protein